MVSTLVVILISLAFAYLLSEISKKIGLPRVVGQIIAGIILGIGLIKSYLFTPDNLDILAFLANLGIILLFYYVGLETNFKVLTKNAKKSILISLFNTSLPLILGFIVMRFIFNFDIIASIIVGVALSVSAQSVSIDLLEELKMLKSKLGSTIISAGAVDDAIELILVSILLSFFHIVISNLTPLRLMLDITIFIAIIVAARLWFLPFALKFFDRENSSTARFMGSLIIVLIIASLAEYLGVGTLIGAMVAGIIIRQTIFKEESIPNWEEHDMARSIHIIAFGFLIPLFFVWIGVNTDLSVLIENIWFIILLVLIAVVGTVGGTALAIKLNKGTWKEGFILGWGLNPKGDIELVIVALALEAGIITGSIFTSLVAMALITTIISPIVFKMLVSKKGKKIIHT
ncbi:MAG: cation:proton antiporter [archaeon]|nr:cation:proton antiporter [Nanoarchaeota archaeon]